MQPLRHFVTLLTLSLACLLTACGGGTGIAIGPAPTALAYSTSSTLYTVCEPIVPNSPILVGGPSTFSVTPALPGGLSLDPQTGLITGAPNAPSSTAFHTITASNQAGSISTSISITVALGPPPSGLSYSAQEVTYGLGIEIAPNVPTITGAVDTWFVVPALPSGLQLDSATGIITGTPTALKSATSYFVTARNCVQQTTTTEVRIAVADPTAPPSSLTYTTIDASYVGCQPIPPNIPILDGFVTLFEIDPPLPSGLTIDPNTGIITGTPDSLQGTTLHSVTASNDAGSLITEILVEVAAPTPPTGLAYSPASATYAVGLPGPPLVPTVTGEVTGYSVFPALPTGLAIDPASGLITGIPTEIKPESPYTVSATDCVGQVTSTQVSIEVADPSVPPSGLVYTLPDADYSACEDITPNLPIVNGLVESFSITPPLPTGLSFDVTTGAITGAATSTAADASYTVTAINAAGSSQTTITISVGPPDPPANLSYEFAIVAYTVGTPIEPNVPSFDGLISSWSISPPLPAGLTLNPETGAISGTPISGAETETYTVSGGNCIGQSTSTQLTLTVVDPSAFVPRFLFTANSDGTVSGLTVDPDSGQLTHNGYSRAGLDPVDLEIAPTGLQLYVLNSGSLTPGTAGITRFSVDSTNGRLTEVGAATSLPDGALPVDMELSDSGSLLYVANPAVDSISGFDVESDGSLTALPGSPFATASQSPVALAIDPLGRFLLTANAAAGDSWVSSFQVSGGLLSNEQRLPLQGLAVSCAALLSSNGTLTVHVATDDAGQGRLESFQVNSTTGSLTPSTTIQLGSRPKRVRGVNLGSDRVVYVCGVASVERYVLNASGVPIAPNPAEPYTVPDASDIAFVTDGSFAFVTLESLDELSSAEVGSSPAGKLTAIAPAASPTDRIRTRDEPRALALASGEQPVQRVTSFVYSTNTSQGDVTQFAFNPAGPGLTQLNPAQALAGVTPDGIAIHPYLDTAYVVDAASGTTEDILTYNIAVDGQLIATGSADLDDAGVPSGDGGVTIVVEPSGRFAYVIQAGLPTSKVIPYSISGSTLNAGVAVDAQDSARYPAIDPTGRFLYVPNQFSGNVSQYRIDPASGSLSSLGTVPAGAAPFAVSIDPTGRFAYVVNRGSNDVSPFQLDSDTGQLVSIGPAVAAGQVPAALITGSRGRMLYVANQFGASISRYLINLNPFDPFPDGTLLSLGSTDLPGQPRWLDLDADGRRMFATLTSTGDVLTLSIDEATGALTIEDVDVSAPGSGTALVNSRDRVE
jgi:6-phosphogluconolactonase (cycloisomerase 2 family)